ncbi:B9 domain-containing protein 2 [Dermatophagoides farinae]|uniref:B9 domain-containing protein 2 n=1 Tax=Dermatophagoides farinae TaxID=6954 RepID=A0A922HNF1_DERFA|nr:B9 domain-containing protein 2 [Dermatophagoides farinae]
MKKLSIEAISKFSISFITIYLILIDGHIPLLFALEPSNIATTSTNLNNITDDQAKLNKNDKQFIRYREEFEKILAKWSNNSKGCECDSILDYCDIDCCCDLNCTEIDRYSFGQCLKFEQSKFISDISEIPSLSMCLDSTNNNNGNQKQLFYQSSPLLCLAKENTFRRQSYVHQPIIIERNQLDRIESKHKFRFGQIVVPMKSIFNDDNDDDDDDVNDDYEQRIIQNITKIQSLVQYKSGSPIIRFRFRTLSNQQQKQKQQKNHTILEYYHWKLPISINSLNNINNRMDVCSGRLEIVKYLKDYQSICLRIVPTNLAEDCTGNQFFDYRTYLQPNVFIYQTFINSEKFNTSSNNSSYKFVRIETDGKHYEQPYYDSETKICHNVVEKVDYLVWHEGIQGIRRIQIWIGQIDLPSISNFSAIYLQSRKFIQQKFNVTFRWFGRKLPTTITKTSLTDDNDENWLQNRPTTKGYKYGQEIKFIRIDQNHTFHRIEKRNFLLGTYAKGLCDHDEKIADSILKFGWNRYEICRLSLNKIMKTMTVNKTDNQQQRQQTTKSVSCTVIKSSVGKYLDFFDYNDDDDNRTNNSSYLFIGSYPPTRLDLIQNDTSIVWIRPLIREINSTTLSMNSNKNNKNSQTNHYKNHLQCTEEIITELMYNFFINRIDQIHYRMIGVEIVRKKSILNYKCTSSNNNVDNDNDDCNLTIDLRTYVNFIDISEPFVPKYAPAPSFRVELPADFFYPFTPSVSSKSSSSIGFQFNHYSSSIIHVFMVMITITIIYFY